MHCIVLNEMSVVIRPLHSCTNPLFEGVEQLRRYADLRETETSKNREGEPRLFFTNQLMISTYGDDCKFGSISSQDYAYQELICYHEPVFHSISRPVQGLTLWCVCTEFITGSNI